MHTSKKAISLCNQPLHKHLKFVSFNRKLLELLLFQYRSKLPYPKLGNTLSSTSYIVITALTSFSCLCSHHPQSHADHSHLLGTPCLYLLLSPSAWRATANTACWRIMEEGIPKGVTARSFIKSQPLGTRESPDWFSQNTQVSSSIEQQSTMALLGLGSAIESKKLNQVIGTSRWQCPDLRFIDQPVRVGFGFFFFFWWCNVFKLMPLVELRWVGIKKTSLNWSPAFVNAPALILMMIELMS